MKIINFLNTILRPDLNTCTSVLIDTKYSAFFLIRKKVIDQRNSAGSEDYRESPKKSINSNSKQLAFQKNDENFLKFAFSNFFVKISNKQFCELDKIPRNFPNWQNFVLVTVYE